MRSFIAIVEAKPESRKPLNAVRFIRSMQSSSRPSLIEASDGGLYVVKTWGNECHPNLLANEFIGASLVKSVGLPTPSPRLMLLSDPFLQQFDLSVRYEGYTHRPVAGLHYATRLIEPPQGTHFSVECLARCYVDFVENRKDFLGMYLLDVCVKHRDARQAIFIKEKGSPASRAIFIDHGHMFGGSEWDFDSTLRIPCHAVLSLYCGLANTKAVNSWVKTLQAKIPSALDTAIAAIPTGWHTGNINTLHTWLNERITFLPGLIAQHIESSPLFRDRVDAQMHLQNTRFRQVRA